MIAGYFQGWVDRALISILIDALLAFPALILAALVVGRSTCCAGERHRGRSASASSWLSRRWAIVIVFSLLSIAPIARIVRAQTLSLRRARVRARGAQPRRQDTARPVPRDPAQPRAGDGRRCSSPASASCSPPRAALAFLGYSVEPPDASWGLMVAENRERDRRRLVGDDLPVPDAVPDRAGVQPDRRPGRPPLRHPGGGAMSDRIQAARPRRATGTLLEVDRPAHARSRRRGAGARRRRRVVHARARQGARASSASRAPARPCCRGRSWACSPARQRRCAGLGALRGPGDHRPSAQADAPHLGPGDVDDLPGPDDVAEPADEDRQADHRAAHRSTSA